MTEDNTQLCTVCHQPISATQSLQYKGCCSSKCKERAEKFVEVIKKKLKKEKEL